MTTSQVTISDLTSHTPLTGNVASRNVSQLCSALPSPFPRLSGPVDGVAICAGTDVPSMLGEMEMYSFTALPCLSNPDKACKGGATRLHRQWRVYAYDDACTDEAGALSKLRALPCSDAKMDAQVTTPLSSSESDTSANVLCNVTHTTTLTGPTTTASHAKGKHKSGGLFGFLRRDAAPMPTQIVTEDGKTLHVSYDRHASKARRTRLWGSALRSVDLYTGGYVIFADAFVETHPGSAIAVVTRAYKEVSAPLEEMVLPAGTEPSESTVGLLEVKRYIREAQQCVRPVFRRRASESVYGTATYTARPTVAAH